MQHPFAISAFAKFSFHGRSSTLLDEYGAMAQPLFLVLELLKKGVISPTTPLSTGIVNLKEGRSEGKQDERALLVLRTRRSLGDSF